MITYEHINDCWNAIREAKTVQEIENLFEDFPRWSGSWCIIKDKESYIVINEYDDENLGWQVDRETVEVIDEFEDYDNRDAEVPLDYTGHFDK